jgi:hypothetical protein
MKLHSIYLGRGDQGQQRKLALERIASREGHTWNGQPSIGRWLVAVADEEIRKETKMDIRVQWSRDALWGAMDPAGWDQEESETNYQHAIVDALYDAYPNADIAVERGIIDAVAVDGQRDHPECAAILDIMEKVWNSSDGWLAV